jgi:hypothetical protein
MLNAIGVRAGFAVLTLAATVACGARASASILRDGGPESVLGELTCPATEMPEPRRRGCGSVSAYGGWVAWTSYDPSLKGYVIWAVRDGVARVLPVSPWERPFDVDLGPDASGRAVVVFSRCQPAEPQWCEPRIVDLATGRLRHVGFAAGKAQLLPSLWHRRLAIVRGGAGVPREVEICRLDGTTAKGCRVVRGGPGGAARRRPWTGPTGIDLSGRGLAIAWRWRPRGGDPSEQRTAILFRRPRWGPKGRRAPPRVIATARGTPDIVAAVHTPVLSGRAVSFVAGYARCGSGSPSAIARYDLRTRKTKRRRVPDLAGMAIAGNASIQVRCADFADSGPVTTAPVIRAR